MHSIGSGLKMNNKLCQALSRGALGGSPKRAVPRGQNGQCHETHVLLRVVSDPSDGGSLHVVLEQPDRERLYCLLLRVPCQVEIRARLSALTPVPISCPVVVVVFVPPDAETRNGLPQAIHHGLAAGEVAALHDNVYKRLLCQNDSLTGDLTRARGRSFKIQNVKVPDTIGSAGLLPLDDITGMAAVTTKGGGGKRCRCVAERPTNMTR
ncbi:hypothetical protein LX36DRAFT_227283 [Colletotrichum falcatum]|nr:hypothetical protein LX36DRAFT_227283 [Colletotrichum falcatum]